MQNSKNNPLAAGAKVILLGVLIMLALAPQSHSQVVIVDAEGRAAGEGSAARAEALTDALREAVRMGAGVDLVSQSQITNFTMDFDRVFAKASGYLKSYKVTSVKLGEDGIYRVNVRAEVTKVAPEVSDHLTLQMTTRLKQTPRISIHINETIKGAAASGLAADWLQNAARGVGLQVVDLSKSQGVGNALAKRAAILGREMESAVRSQGVMDQCDYLIEGTLVGDYTGAQSLYGAAPRHKFSLAVNLKVIDAATGSVVVIDNPPSLDVLIPNAQSVDVAAREAVRRLMEGDGPGAKSESGWKIMRRLFVHWTTEMDLGTTVRLDLTGLTLETAQKLRDDLTQEEMVSAVWIRSVDTAAVSIIDVETRLDTTNLAQRVVKIAAGFQLDRSAARYISFIPSKISPVSPAISAGLPAPSQSIPVVATLAVANQPSTQPDSSTTILLAAGLLIIVGLIVAIFLLLKRGNQAK